MKEEITLRNRKSSHNISLAFNVKWNPKGITKQTLYIRYKYGSTPARYKTTGFKLQMQDWDKNKEVIKNKEKHIELSKWIAEFKQKQEDVLIQIALGKIDLKDAFAILTGKTTKGSILNSVEENGKLKNKTTNSINKAYERIRAVQTGLVKLGYNQYSSLDYEHLSNHADIQTITKAVQEDFDVKNNTKNGYLKYLNYAYQWNPDTPDKVEPFKEFLTGDEYVPQPPVNKHKFNDGIINIGDNSQWFEAYLFWLLSFCLRGLNGADICLMDKSWITDVFGDKISDLRHYLPDLHKLIDTEGETFTNKIYITGKRTKSGVGIKILLNQFPTLIILRLLKRMVAHNRPSFAYTGSDPIKIYNIDYYTERGKADWKNVLNTYSDQFKKMNGFTMSSARNTFTDILKNTLKAQGDMLSVSLGHRPSKATHNKYASVSQETLDILHTEVLRVWNINGVIQLMHQIHKEKSLSVITTSKDLAYKGVQNIQITGKLGWFNTIQPKELEALNLPLTNWGYQKEDALQKLLAQQKMMSTGTFNPETNQIEYSTDTTNYTKELKDLIKEKENILKERYEALNKKVKVNFNTTTQKVEIIDSDNNKIIKLDSNEKNVDATLSRDIV